MRILLPLLLVGFAACYSPRSVGPGPDGYAPGLYGTASHHVPLQANLWIDPYTGFASFDISREAHVALFVWVPGGNFEMLYPAIGYGTRQHFHSGRHHLRSLRTLAAGHSRGSRLQTRFATSTMTGPTYFMLIASDEPLDVQPFYGRAAWISRVSWSNNPYTATELLASQIVPRPATTEWTVAYQAVWFEDQWRPRDRYRWVQCPDGVTLMVPLEALYAGLVHCPSGDTVEPPPGDTADAAAAQRLARRIAERRAGQAGMDVDRASDAEVADMIRRIHQVRGGTAEDAPARPIPSWQRGQRSASAPVVLPERPDIRSERADRPQAGSRASTPAIRPGVRSSPRPEGARARRPADRPQAEPASPQPERPRPQAERPRPQAERPRPQAERPAPSAERPRPAPQRPPDDTI